ncbi:MAG: hypothetical protein Kow0069_33040 [Promethearchaeota archaeon]
MRAATLTNVALAAPREASSMSTQVGLILVVWEEDFGPVLVDAQPPEFFEEKGRNSQDLAVSTFMTAQSVFGGGGGSGGFEKTQFVLPLHFADLRVKIFFDFVDDPDVRGGRRPVLLAVFTHVNAPNEFFDFFDPFVERALSLYKTTGDSSLSVVLETFEDRFSTETLVLNSTFVLDEYPFEEALKDLEKAERSYQSKDLATAQILATKAGMRLALEKSKPQAGKAFYLAGLVQFQLQDYAVAREYFQMAFSNLVDAGELEVAAQAEFYLGSCEFYLGDHGDALSHIIHAGEILHATDFAPLVKKTLANLFRELGKFEEAREAFRQALETYQQLGMNEALADVACHYADFLVAKFLKPNLAREAELGVESPLVQEIKRSYSLAAAKWREERESASPDEAMAFHKLARALDVTGLLEMSNEYYEKAFDVFMELGDVNRAINDLVNVGNNLGQLGDFDGALECYERAFREFKQHAGISLLDIDVLGSLFFETSTGTGGVMGVEGAVNPRIVDEDLVTVAMKNEEMTRKILPLFEVIGSESEASERFIEAAKIYERAYELAHTLGDTDAALRYKNAAFENYCAASDQHHKFARFSLIYEHDHAMAFKYSLLAFQWAMLAALFAGEERPSCIEHAQDQLQFVDKVAKFASNVLNAELYRSFRERLETLVAVYHKIKNADEVSAGWEDVFEVLSLRRGMFEPGAD